MKSFVFTIVYGFSLLAPALFTQASTAASSETAQTVKNYQIEGYRSAKFGMTEAQLRAAIAKDFPTEANKLVVDEHPIEKTKVITIDVNNLIDEAGVAKITYILGYKTKKLIQVNIAWGTAITNQATPSMAQLKSAALTLANYFSGYSFKPKSVQTNLSINENTLVVFSAQDSQNRQLQLTLGETSKSKTDKPASAPANFLRMSYGLDTNSPDIYRIEAGSF